MKIRPVRDQLFRAEEQRDRQIDNDEVTSQLGSTTDGTTTLRHTGHVTTHYKIYRLFDLYFN
jgi:hypothetical protein